MWVVVSSILMVWLMVLWLRWLCICRIVLVVLLSIFVFSFSIELLVLIWVWVMGIVLVRFEVRCSLKFDKFL